MKESLHPGGKETTLWMLEQAGLSDGKHKRALDLGSGYGQTLELLEQAGYTVQGVDLKVRNQWTQAGDFTRLDLKEGFFDLIISECALYLSGQQEHVLTQLPSFLKPEGVVLISDLFPYERNQLAGLFSKTGLQLLFVRDITELWKEYILECLWAGQWNGCVQKEKKELHYYLLGAKNKEKRQ